MQFLEWSLAGLRSARRVYVDAARGHRITLFPMVHVGEAAFFDKVFEDARGHDRVVTEGIGSSVSKRLTRAYRWGLPARLGLVVQPRFEGGHGQVVRGDLDPDAFEALWRRAPFRERALFELGAAGFGLWSRVAASRAFLGKRLSTSDLTDRETILSWSPRNARLLDALYRERDAVLWQTIQRLCDKADAPLSIAVIFGAGHMGTLSHALIEDGFQPVESAWMTVFGP